MPEPCGAIWRICRIRPPVRIRAEIWLPQAGGSHRGCAGNHLTSPLCTSWAFLPGPAAGAGLVAAAAGALGVAGGGMVVCARAGPHDYPWARNPTRCRPSPNRRLQLDGSGPSRPPTSLACGTIARPQRPSRRRSSASASARWAAGVSLPPRFWHGLRFGLWRTGWSCADIACLSFAQGRGPAIHS